MVEPKNSLKAAAAAITTVLVAHGAHQSEVCFSENYDCPEPEQTLPDMPEHGRPTGPDFTPSRTSGPTGPGPRTITGTGALNATASIVEGSDGMAGSGTITPGTGALNVVSAAPQIYEDTQPRILPSVT